MKNWNLMTNFKYLVKDEQQRLIRQCSVIKEYIEILEERISSFIEYRIHREPERRIFLQSMLLI